MAGCGPTPQGLSLEQLWGVLEGARQRVKWVRVNRVLGETGIPKDSPAGRQQFELRMEQRRREERGTDRRKLRRGWGFGDETFRQELPLRQVIAQILDFLAGKHSANPLNRQIF